MTPNAVFSLAGGEHSCLLTLFPLPTLIKPLLLLLLTHLANALSSAPNFGSRAVSLNNTNQTKPVKTPKLDLT